MHKEESFLGTGRFTNINEIVNEFRAVSYRIRHGQRDRVVTGCHIGVGRVL